MDDKDMRWAKAIQRQVERQGMHTGWLAERLGWGVAQVDRLLRGELKLSYGQKCAIFRALGGGQEYRGGIGDYPIGLTEGEMLDMLENVDPMPAQLRLGNM